MGLVKRRGSPNIFRKEEGDDGANYGPLGFPAKLATYKHSSHTHGRRLRPPPPPPLVLLRAAVG